MDLQSIVVLHEDCTFAPQVIVVFHAYFASTSGKTSQIPILCPTHQGQETSVLLASCLQSNPSDVQQNDRPQISVLSSSSKVTMEQADDDKGVYSEPFCFII